MVLVSSAAGATPSAAFGAPTAADDAMDAEAAATSPAAVARAQTDASAIAARWAPIHYQDTDSTDFYSDFITRVAYDGTWDTTDNWDNLHAGDYVVDADDADPASCSFVLDIAVCHDAHTFVLDAHVYYSVVETCTHWFVVYDFFHARDWTDSSFDQEHENDFEEVLVVVRRTPVEAVEAVVTQAHGHYFSYLPAGSPLLPGEEDLDGVVPMAEYPPGSGMLRPETAQEAKGHGAGARGDIGDFAGEPERDGVIYVPSGVAEQPASGNDRDAGYALLSFFEPGGLWERQLLEERGAIAADTYHRWGTFRGDGSGSCGDGITVECSDNAAKTPWGADDADDGPDVADPPLQGEVALDPAHFTDVYFDGLGAFDRLYVSNGYIQGLAEAGFGPQPDGSILAPATYSGPTLDAAFFGKVAAPDADSDGVDRCDEMDAGSDPGDADSDDDGVDDADDAFPTDPAESADADGDGTGDNADTDDDNDELADSLDPSPMNPDADGDGLLDGEDVEFLQEALRAVTEVSFRPPSAGTRTAFLSVLEDVEALLLTGDVEEARRKLVNLRRRIDGCGESPDPNDWIVSCSDQQAIRSLLDLLAANLAS